MNRNFKIANQIKELSAIFLERENNHTSLITVTSSDLSPDLKNVTIFVTVLPDEKEALALDFLKRKRKELREFLKKQIKIKTIHFIDIKIDEGEKNRRKIDELLRER